MDTKEFRKVTMLHARMVSENRIWAGRDRRGDIRSVGDEFHERVRGTGGFGTPAGAVARGEAFGVEEQEAGVAVELGGG